MASALRAALACLGLLCLAAPAWPQQIDDQLITLAFAHNWASTGLIQWNTGAVVEGCSSFLQLVLATAYVVAGGPDANIFVKALALASGLATVCFASLLLPHSRAGHLLLAAVVLWEPLAWWSAAGMETTLYTLLLALGWVGVAGAESTGALIRLEDSPPSPGGRRGGADSPPSPAVAHLPCPWGRRGGQSAERLSGLILDGNPSFFGLAALWLAATAHPEGNVHFAVGAVVVLSREHSWRQVVAFTAALAVYHVLRVGYYGSFLPTPWLVKIAANPALGGQWRQVGWELLTAAGILCSLLLFRFRAVGWLPLGIQMATALRAEPDWMAHARHLLPGIVATALLLGTGRERSVGRAGWAVVPVVLLSTLSVCPGLDGPRLRSLKAALAPAYWYGAALDTSQLEDVVWMVENAPEGGTVITEDVGMPGNIPGVRILDLVGLTDRDVALAAAGDEAADRRIAHRLKAPPDRPALVRRMHYGGEAHARPVQWIKLPEPTTRTYPQGTALWYRLTPKRPSEAQIAWRWAVLHQRYPSQGPVAWYHAMAEAEHGRLRVAARIADEMRAQFPYDPVIEALGAALYAPFPLEDFETIPSALRQISRPISRAEAPGLVVTVAVTPSGSEGQRVSVRWSCSTTDNDVIVPGDKRIELPTWTCPGDSAVVVVAVMDDRPHRPLARDLYVGLGAR